MAVVGSLSTVLPGYFGSLGARAFLRPRPNTSARHWEAAFEGFQHRDICVDGHRVPFWINGCGPLVLLVHGWERDHFAMGGFVAPLLDAGYTVAALDLPGHGAAEGDSAPLPLLAKAIAAVAEALGPPCAVVAHSIGAAMTVLAMEAHGLQPDSAVLICAPRTAKDYALAQARRQGLGRRALQQMVLQINEALGEPLERYRVDRALSSLAMPILLVHAEDDAIVPLADAQENLQASSARSFWLPCGGHNRILGDSHMIGVVLEWINCPVHEPAGA
jgi:pimeloyl-ACP methyl ester carboxylesterase